MLKRFTKQTHTQKEKEREIFFFFIVNKVESIILNKIKCSFKNPSLKSAFSI